MPRKRKPHIDENDFDALDRLAHSITLENTRPLTPAMRRHWEEAKRSGPRNNLVSITIYVDPTLLRQADDYAKKARISRSQFFADAIRKQLRRAG